MRKLLCILLAFSILIPGCNPTYHVYPLNDEKCAEINAKTQGRKAALILKNVRDEMVVENILVRKDTSIWINPYNLTRTSAAPNLISEIKITDHTKGLLYGCGAGAVCLLALAAVGDEDGTKGNIGSGNYEITAAGWVRFFAVTLAIILPIAGAVKGIESTYILQDPVTAADDFKSRLLGNNVEVTFSSIVEKGPDYIIIDWRGKNIHLLRSEYQYTATVGDGRKIILISKEVYESKFLDN